MSAPTVSRALRPRFSLRQEFLLALLPTVTVLAMLALVEVFSRQRLLFASLASSAFLIYLDPLHATNRVRTLIVAQALASVVGTLVFFLLGPGYLAAGGAMLLVIAAMIVLDAMHPPAVSTALSFAFRASNENNLALFGLALLLVAVLITLQRLSLWLLARFSLAERG